MDENLLYVSKGRQEKAILSGLGITRIGMKAGLQGLRLRANPFSHSIEVSSLLHKVIETIATIRIVYFRDF